MDQQGASSVQKAGVARRMVLLPVFVGTPPPPPNSILPQKHHLSICQGHTGGRKFPPYLNRSWLGKVHKKKSPVCLHMCQVCRGNILKCRPPLGRKNSMENQGLSLETEPPGGWPPPCPQSQEVSNRPQAPPPVGTCYGDVSHQHRLGDFGPH